MLEILIFRFSSSGNFSSSSFSGFLWFVLKKLDKEAEGKKAFCRSKMFRVSRLDDEIGSMFIYRVEMSLQMFQREQTISFSSHTTSRWFVIRRFFCVQRLPSAFSYIQLRRCLTHSYICSKHGVLLNEEINLKKSIWRGGKIFGLNLIHFECQ